MYFNKFYKITFIFVLQEIIENVLGNVWSISQKVLIQWNILTLFKMGSMVSNFSVVLIIFHFTAFPQ